MSTARTLAAAAVLLGVLALGVPTAAPAPTSTASFTPATGHWVGDVDVLFLPAPLRFDVTREAYVDGTQRMRVRDFWCGCQVHETHGEDIRSNGSFGVVAPYGFFFGRFVDAHHAVGHADLASIGRANWRAHLVEPGVVPRFVSPPRFELEVGRETHVNLVSEGHPDRYSVLQGALPAGVHLTVSSGVGHLRGRPTGGDGTYHLLVSAANRWGNAIQDLTLVVRPRHG